MIPYDHWPWVFGKPEKKLKYVLKHQKNMLNEVGKQTSYKELHELAREHFWYSHKNSYLFQKLSRI